MPIKSDLQNAKFKKKLKSRLLTQVQIREMMSKAVFYPNRPCQLKGAFLSITNKQSFYQKLPNDMQKKCIWFNLKVARGHFSVSQSNFFCMFENLIAFLPKCQAFRAIQNSSSAARKQTDKQESKSVLFRLTCPVWQNTSSQLNAF